MPEHGIHPRKRVLAYCAKVLSDVVIVEGLSCCQGMHLLGQEPCVYAGCSARALKVNSSAPNTSRALATKESQRFFGLRQHCSLISRRSRAQKGSSKALRRLSMQSSRRDGGAARKQTGIVYADTIQLPTEDYCAAPSAVSRVGSIAVASYAVNLSLCS